MSKHPRSTHCGFTHIHVLVAVVAFVAALAAEAADCYKNGPQQSCCVTQNIVCRSGASVWNCQSTSDTSGCFIGTVVIAPPGDSGKVSFTTSTTPTCSCNMTYKSCGPNPGECISGGPSPVSCYSSSVNSSSSHCQGAAQ